MNNKFIILDHNS